MLVSRGISFSQECDIIFMTINRLWLVAAKQLQEMLSLLLNCHLFGEVRIHILEYLPGRNINGPTLDMRSFNSGNL